MKIARLLVEHKLTRELILEVQQRLLDRYADVDVLSVDDLPDSASLKIEHTHGPYIVKLWSLLDGTCELKAFRLGWEADHTNYVCKEKVDEIVSGIYELIETFVDRGPSAPVHPEHQS